jgi:hypothetical protein
MVGIIEAGKCRRGLFIDEEFDEEFDDVRIVALYLA